MPGNYTIEGEGRDTRERSSRTHFLIKEGGKVAENYLGREEGM